MIKLSIVLALALTPLAPSLQGERPGQRPERHKAGTATMYTAETGAPLYCDQFLGPDGSLTYDQSTGPWVAIDVGDYGSFAECGDWLLLAFEDGRLWAARALDAGLLEGNKVDGLPIVADVPELWRHDWRLSWPVSVYNVSRWLEAWPHSKLTLDKK